MTDRMIVRRGAYHDSIALMLASRVASETDGAGDVAVAMATPVNLDLIRSRGFDLSDADGATASDLVIAIRADDSAAAGRILAAVDGALSADASPVAGPGAASPPVSLRAAVRHHPEVNLAVLSVPGRYVAYEVALALESGLHVFCFSDGVTVDEEAVLKRAASERGLMLMGPDCGTAIVDGVALGFANAVMRGPVGIVGASGTGIQEVSCLLDRAGVGVSHAIGVGGRDLAPEIGGSMMRQGLELLAADPGTEVIVAISKPPDPAVALAIREHAATIGKPAILAFLGLEDPPSKVGTVEYADGLEQAAARAARLVGREVPPFDGPSWSRSRILAGHIRGLFSGGTLCTEAMRIVSATISPIASNIPLRVQWRIGDVDRSEGHTFIDFGSDELTAGRPHPMIDPTPRVRRLEREADDRGVGVILLDIVLGHGAHPDPASEFAPAIGGALAARDDLAVIVALVGTDRDRQGLAGQRARLERAGALVTRSVAHAARLTVTGLEATR